MQHNLKKISNQESKNKCYFSSFILHIGSNDVSCVLFKISLSWLMRIFLVNCFEKKIRHLKNYLNYSTCFRLYFNIHEDILPILSVNLILSCFKITFNCTDNIICINQMRVRSMHKETSIAVRVDAFYTKDVIQITFFLLQFHSDQWLFISIQSKCIGRS